jgi:DNA-binding NtrC family response regulator
LDLQSDASTIEDVELEILLVVDDHQVERALQLALSRAGHRVMTSSSVPGTVEVMTRRGGEFDVIVIDMQNHNGNQDDAERYARFLGTNARVMLLRDAAILDLTAPIAT